MQSIREKLLEGKDRLWKSRLEYQIRETLVFPEVERCAALVAAFWNEGIMSRIAPTHIFERQARERTQRLLWPGTREDIELYWRILYALGFSIEAIKKNFSLIASNESFVAGVFQNIELVFSPEVKALFPHHRNNPYIGICEALMDYAREEITKRGAVPHNPLIPWESVGTWEGMELTVDRYTQDGLISFRARNFQDHRRLSDLMGANFSGISPSCVNPQDFKVTN
ncbi:MAG: hypothetical protein KGI50_00950 [Patescibacteria group bacterium]|nr:hypothetical protein [Patescibacteria group bacterium]MDE2438080.1 hypothetical protein [Patescibacteria group bacterium]